MARKPKDGAGPRLVVIEDGLPTLTFDEWLTLVAGDEPTDRDADAGAILRKIREHGEH